MNAPELTTITRPILALIILASTAFAADPKIPWVQMDAVGGKLAAGKVTGQLFESNDKPLAQAILSCNQDGTAGTEPNDGLSGVATRLPRNKAQTPPSF